MTAPTTIIPVILSGGSGTRLWPMSTPEQPKQLLALTADETMLQLTARARPRASGSPRRSSSPMRAMPTMIEAAAGGDRRAARTLILEPVGAQHRAGDRAGGAGRGAATPSAGDADRPCHRRRRRVPRRDPRRAAAGRAGLAGDLRDRARRARDRLWLYRDRRGDRRRRPPRRALRRKAAARPRRGDAGGGRACLERRHLPVPRRRLSRRAGGPRARHAPRRATGDGKARRAKARASCPTPTPSPPRRRNRSTMR